jgi:N-acyl homoserine lactone hydrolase
MAEDPVAPFGKSYDVFGDGSVTAVLTPGHSAGSMAVLARGDAGYVAFVGDDSYNRNSWEEGRLPGPLTSADDMRRALGWVRGLAHDPECLGIYAAHDPKGPLGGNGL